MSAFAEAVEADHIRVTGGFNDRFFMKGISETSYQAAGSCKNLSVSSAQINAEVHRYTAAEEGLARNKNLVSRLVQLRHKQGAA